MKIILKMLAYVGLPILLLWYGIGAYYRSTAGGCVRETKGSYVGEVCYMALRDSSLFRVYDANTEAKLAERMFTEIAEHRIVWADDRVIYKLGGDPGDQVRLPPTLLDRIRAKLP